MSSYLRPRRGKQSTAASTLTSSNPLKRGEIFFEVPTGGVGSGQGKIKMGDGSTAYSSLPYFMSMDDSVVTFTDSSASSTWDNCNSYLGNIKSNISLPTFFANTKNLLYQLVSKVTSLNNDLGDYIQLKSGSFSGSKINYIYWSNYLYQNIASFLFAFSTSTGLSSKDVISRFDQLKNKSGYGYILIESTQANFRGVCYLDNGDIITNDNVPVDSYICRGIVYIN